MNLDEVMDWIDNAGDRELQKPPQQVRERLAQDKECMRYYRISLKLKQQKKEVDLWSKFQKTLTRQGYAVSEKKGAKKLFNAKRLWGLSAAGAAAVIALVLILFPFGWKQKSEIYTEEIVYSDPLELTLEIISDFGSDEQYDMSALDYYYAITNF
jgi:hypothetical protein